MQMWFVWYHAGPQRIDKIGRGSQMLMYIHIPYCDCQDVDYCSFNSYVGKN